MSFKRRRPLLQLALFLYRDATSGIMFTLICREASVNMVTSHPSLEYVHAVHAGFLFAPKTSGGDTVEDYPYSREDNTLSEINQIKFTDSGSAT